MTLHEWLQERGYSQSQLARELGLSQSLVNLTIMGRRAISEGFMWRFARRFGQAEAERIFIPCGDGSSACDSPESSGGSTQGGASSSPPATTDPAQAFSGTSDVGGKHTACVDGMSRPRTG
jgi:transcriptional regulator with XRE-family HTH domain